MAIRGQLDRVKLFQVFRSIMQKRMTGVLTLQSGRDIRRAEVVNGYPVRTASNRRSDGLFAALVHEGLISSTEEAQLRAHIKQHPVPLDALLVEQGFVSPQRLKSVQRAVARRILLAPFVWHEGAFEFKEQLIRPGPNAEGIDLVDLLVEAAARTVTEQLAGSFVRRYAGQYVAPTELSRVHGQRFDDFFPPPNTRTMLEAPARFDLIARTRGDAALAAREVTSLVLSGLAQFQQSVRPVAEDEAPEPASRGGRRQIRRVSSPANLRKRQAPMPPSGGPARSAPPPATSAPPPRVTTSAPPRRVSAAPPPPSGAPSRSRRPRPASDATPRAARQSPSAADADQPPRPSRGGRGGRGHKPPTPAILASIATAKGQGAQLDSLTHYDVLGVAKDADSKAVRSAFRSLAREFHVDKFMRYDLPQGDIEAVQAYFIAINRANEVLSSADERANYDTELDLRAQGVEVDPDGGGPDISKVFAAEKLVKQGITLLKNGKPSPALERFNEALTTIPDDPLGRAGQAYADLLVTQADGGASQMVHARAVRILEEICEELEGRHEPFLYLGRVYRMNDEHAKAVAVLMKALKISPHCAETASELRHLQRKPAAKKSGLFGRRKK